MLTSDAPLRRDLSAERARRGAIKLDTLLPRWERQVDPARIDMGAWDRDVLSQLFGSFADGMLLLMRDPEFRDRDATVVAVQLGHNSGTTAEGFSTIGGLDAAWRELVAERGGVGRAAG